MAKKKIHAKNIVSNLAVWVFIAGAVGLILSTVVTLAQIIVWAFENNFWGAIGLCSAITMVIAVLIIRRIPEKE